MRKTIYRLQRLNAVGLYGGDYIFKTLWDEYCHEVQEGPHDDLQQYGWDDILGRVMDDVVSRIPKHAAVLLTIYAADEDPKLVGGVSPDDLKQVLRDQLERQAINRNLDHLSRWRNY